MTYQEKSKADKELKERNLTEVRDVIVKEFCEYINIQEVIKNGHNAIDFYGAKTYNLLTDELKEKADNIMFWLCGKADENLWHGCKISEIKLETKESSDYYGIFSCAFTIKFKSIYTNESTTLSYEKRSSKSIGDFDIKEINYYNPNCGAVNSNIMLPPANADVLNEMFMLNYCDDKLYLNTLSKEDKNDLLSNIEEVQEHYVMNSTEFMLVMDAKITLDKIWTDYQKVLEFKNEFDEDYDGEEWLETQFDKLDLETKFDGVFYDKDNHGGYSSVVDDIRINFVADGKFDIDRLFDEYYEYTQVKYLKHIKQDKLSDLRKELRERQNN